MAIRFKAKLERHKETEVLRFDLPINVLEVFGTRARLAVKGTISGFPFRSSIFPKGGGQFYLVVNREMREGANVKAGDTVEFVMEKDETPRAIETPPDLAKALKANKAAQAAWEKLSFSHKREYVGAIVEAKRPETRTRRIASAIDMLAAMKPRAKASAKKPAKKSKK